MPGPMSCIGSRFTGRYALPTKITYWHLSRGWTSRDLRFPQSWNHPFQTVPSIKTVLKPWSHRPTRERCNHEDSIFERRYKHPIQETAAGRTILFRLKEERTLAASRKSRKSNCLCPVCVFVVLSAPLNPVLCHSQPFVGNVRFVVRFDIGSPPGHPRLPSAHM